MRHWLGSCVVALFVVACGGGSPGAAKMGEDGHACETDNECGSAHCDHGICCRAGGTCCNSADTCPASLATPAACKTTGAGTDCQGSRAIAACEEHVCISKVVEDDSGCNGQTRDCGNFKPISCSDAVTQDVAACASSCAAPGDCASGFTCVANACVKIAAAGQTCTGTGQGSCASSALKCQNGVCCDAKAGTCCSSSDQCSNSLACNTSTSTCYENCTNDTSDRCATPATQVCELSVCAKKQDDGVSCTNNAQCTSNVCECADSSCSTKKCGSKACGTCSYLSGSSCSSMWYAADTYHTPACTGAYSCYPNAGCKKLDGQYCTTDAECGGGRCRSGGKCGSASGVRQACNPAYGNIDCASGLICTASGLCLQPNGTTCGGTGLFAELMTPEYCASGNCVESVCCDTACDSGCGSCNLPNHVGTCTPVTNTSSTCVQPADPNQSWCTPNCVGRRFTYADVCSVYDKAITCTSTCKMVWGGSCTALQEP